MSAKTFFARNLAAALLAGPWLANEMIERAIQAWGKHGRWLGNLIRRILAAFAEPPGGAALEDLATFIYVDPGFTEAWRKNWWRQEMTPRRIFWVAPEMSPVAATPAVREIPAFPTSAALAEWLGLSVGELDWFADRQGREAKVPSGPLRHYTYRWLPKPSGRARLLEMPKLRLKTIQRRLLKRILDPIPPHDSVHSYRPGRSVATYAAAHCGQEIVLRFDLRDFFTSIPAARVHALFRSIGYPRAVAQLLTGLCTNVVPADIRYACPFNSRGSGGAGNLHHLKSPHLPQGAPSSPALANLCAYRLDCRLAALAHALGASYTRYADDLAFSGGVDLARCARRFQVQVCVIALEEGFEVNTRKTRFMRRGLRQQLAGIVLNDRVNIRRDDYERLKAILHNCIRFGPHTQNRHAFPDFRSHLRGRIGYVEMINPKRGRKLRSWFEAIRWEQ
jgi:RNA-directed DNA polymerase